MSNTYKWFRVPGSSFAYNFPEAQPNLTAAKQWIREWLNVKRLPNNIEIW